MEEGAVKRWLGDRWQSIPTEGKSWDWPVESGRWEFFGKRLEKVRWEVLRQGLDLGRRGYDWVYEHKPAGVLVWTDAYPLTRGAVIAANELVIPSMEIVHGLTHSYRIGHWEAKGIARWKFCTPEYRRWAEFYGIESRLIVTGSPIVDPYVGIDTEHLQSVARSELAIPLGAPTVCYLSDMPFERSTWGDSGYSIGAFTEFAKAWRMVQAIMPGVHLIVKMHPVESKHIWPRKYEQALGELGIDKDYTIVDDPLAVALAAADLTVGIQSTAMSIGLCLGVPGLVLGYEPFFPEWLYKGTGIEVCRDARELPTRIVELLGGRLGDLIDLCPDGAFFFTGNPDGKASNRIYRAVCDLVDGKEPSDDCWAQAQPRLRATAPGGILGSRHPLVGRDGSSL